MAKQFPAFLDDHTRFIADQHVYFVGTAAATGHVNISPKGMDSLRVLTPNRLIWLSVTGSGNETPAHLALDPRMTVMWCSFTLRPVILRAYGTARTLHLNHPDWPDLAAHLPALPGARQIYDMQVDLVQTSCGYAVPFLDFRAERPTLIKWAEDKTDDDMAAYWTLKNSRSIDDFPTGIEANL